MRALLAKRRSLFLALALLALHHGAGAEAGQSPQRSPVCNDLARHASQQQRQVHSRQLNHLLFDAAKRGCLELAKQALDQGASISARDRFGNTALVLAAAAGETKVATLLLERGAKVDRANLAGSTALLRAAIADERRSVKLLLSAKANPNVVNRRGLTAVTAAAFNGNERLLAMLLEAGAAPNPIDATGKSPIVYGAAKGFAAIVSQLLDAGVPVDGRAGQDLTALMWAAGHGNDVPPDEGIETARLLLEQGASVDLTDDRGRTALMIAAERGHDEMVGVLLAAGADPAHRDRSQLSAYDLAANDRVRALLSP